MASSPAAAVIGMITTGAVPDDDASRLRAALGSCGIFLGSSSLALVFSKTPGAVLVTWHGRAAAYTYYSVLLVTVAFGVTEAAFGFWVVPMHPRRWSLAAKVLLSVSMAPLVVVLALWAGLRL